VIEQVPTVVVVDDSSTIRVFFERVMQSLHVRLYTFASAAESLEFLGHTRPDLMFLDIIMPGKDGLTFLQELRADPNHTSTSVVMISSKDYAQDRALAKSLGVVEYVTKPMSTQTIRDVVLRHLPQAAALDATASPPDARD
jgi:CheY-like chemotaxis protein